MSLAEGKAAVIPSASRVPISLAGRGSPWMGTPRQAKGLIQYRIRGGEGLKKKKREACREIQICHSWEDEPLIFPCLNPPPCKRGWWELSSPPRAVRPSDGVAWGALLPIAAAAQAEYHVKGGRVPAVVPPPSFLHSPLKLGFGFFFRQKPPFESFQGARERSQPHTPWQLLLASASTRHRLPPGYQGPADAKPHSGLLFAKP